MKMRAIGKWKEKAGGAQHMGMASGSVVDGEEEVSVFRGFNGRIGVTIGRVFVVASMVATLFVASVIMCGCGGSDDTSKGTLVVKGLYMGMPGDDALEVCNKIAASSKDFLVVDFRKGLEFEKAKKDKLFKLAEQDVEEYLEWHSEDGSPYKKGGRKMSLLDGKWSGKIPGQNNVTCDMACLAVIYDYQIEMMAQGKRKSDGKREEISCVMEIPAYVQKVMKEQKYGWISSWEDLKSFLGSSDRAKKVRELCNEKGLDIGSSPTIYYRLVLKKITGEEVAKETVVRDLLDGKMMLMRILPKNLITISLKKEGVSEDELPDAALVWINDEGNVKQVFFVENGLDRIFNAGDLSGEEFAESVVKNYSMIPSLTQSDEESVLRADNGESIHIKESTWVHKDPKGFQVNIFERTAYYKNGVGKIDVKKAADDSPLVLALAMAKKLPKKTFSITAIKPESARKFD